MRILRFNQQGTDGRPSHDFFQEHLGRVTASRAAAVLDFTQKGIEGSKRRLYRLEKVAEILSGIAVHDNYVSAAMRAGTFSEPTARAVYELEEGIMVDQVGMVVGDDERTGWSPDGLCGDMGAIECKCPTTTTHLQTLDAGAIPEDNLPQLWFALMVDAELEWIDFVSRDGGMSKDDEKFGAILPRRYVQFTIRLWRKDAEEQIAKMRAATDRFLVDVDATVERLKKRAPEIEEPRKSAFDSQLEASLGLDEADLAILDRKESR